MDMLHGKQQKAAATPAFLYTSIWQAFKVSFISQLTQGISFKGLLSSKYDPNLKFNQIRTSSLLGGCLYVRLEKSYMYKSTQIELGKCLVPFTTIRLQHIKCFRV